MGMYVHVSNKGACVARHFNYHYSIIHVHIGMYIAICFIASLKPLLGEHPETGSCIASTQNGQLFMLQVCTNILRSVTSTLKCFLLSSLVKMTKISRHQQKKLLYGYVHV